MSVAFAPDASAPASDASAAANPCLVDDGQNFAESFNLRVAAFFIIFVCSALGVVLPLVVRFRTCLSGAVRDGWLFIAKAFGAGVILAVGFIHVFPDAFTKMSDPCLESMSQDFAMALVGWPSYPWAGMIATLSAIAVLILEGCVTALFQRGNSDAGAHSAAAPPQAPPDVESSKDLTTAYVHGHAHCQGDNDSKVDKVRHLTIAQVLIGVTIGVASDLGVVRSLLAALTFHQFFEGIALGACFMEAQISRWSYTVMGAIFALSTPLGVAIGLGIQATYHEHSPNSLGVQGVFDSLSAGTPLAWGILVYMALVDLIAVDFVETKRSLRSKFCGYIALFLGALAMGILAIWA